MRRTPLIMGAAGALLSACNLVAGLDQFYPATTSTDTATSAGGATSTSGDTTTTNGMSTTTASTTTTGPATTTGQSMTKTSSSSSSGGPCADHLLINEARLHMDFVELFNPTSTAIDLTQYRIEARTGAGNFDVKWSGTNAGVIGPGALFLIANNPSDYPNYDATMTGISDSADPTVVVLLDESNTIVDSLCACSMQGCSQTYVSGEELCDGRAFVSANFQGQTTMSAARLGCVDSDLDGADFDLACPTAGLQNAFPPCN